MDFAPVPAKRREESVAEVAAEAEGEVGYEQRLYADYD